MVLYFARFTNLSALVTLLVTTLLLATKGLNFGVDFAGGMIIEVHYPWAVGSKLVQDTLVQAGLADASVKEINGYPSDFFHCLPTNGRSSLTTIACRAAGDCGLAHETAPCGGTPC